MNKKLRIEKTLTILLVCLYIAMVFYYTVGSRAVGLYEMQLDLFWSYRLWFAGSKSTGQQILANIAMLAPVGFLLSEKKRYILVPVLVTVSIEVLQLVTHRGCFELDDLFNNTLGALLGWLIGRVVGRKYKLFFGTVAVLALGYVVLTKPVFGANYTSMFCFQMEEDGSGFCFRLANSGEEGYSILFRDTTTLRTVDGHAETGLESPKVAAYFGEKYRYAGFTASLPKDGEYEVLISGNLLSTMPTGVYVGSSGLHYVPEREYTAPDFHAPFIEEGTLRVYRPDYHCFVYQYEGALYWVCDRDFYFEEDGSTYIQYQLWTTKKDLLPEKRLQNNWFWDNIGGNFEDYEIFGDWNGYRVMRRELPTAYPITSILTGYFVKGDWIWKEYFRPHYDFQNVPADAIPADRRDVPADAFSADRQNGQVDAISVD